MAVPENLEAFETFFYNYLDRLGFDDIVKTLGLKPHAADGQTLSMEMPLTDAVSQASGMYAAAALFGAADITGTLLAMTSYQDKKMFPLAVQSNQNYMSNTKDDKVISTARLLRGGASVAVAETTVHTKDGKPLMHATFTYMLKERALGK